MAKPKPSSSSTTANPDKQTADTTFAPAAPAPVTAPRLDASNIADATDCDTDDWDENNVPLNLAGRTQEATLLGGPATQLTILPEGLSHGDAISMLSRNIPNNEYGLPMFFYRSDFIPRGETQIEQDVLDNAAVGLSYTDGYPTQPQGQAFWAQLSWEPLQDYLLFQRFIDMAEIHGLRQLDLLAIEEATPLERVRSSSQEFYWTARARAHDLFVAAADTKRREHRIRNAENVHFLRAQAMFDTVVTKFDNPEWIDKLEPMEALEAMETLIKIQRMSLGLGMGPTKLQDPQPKAASAEFIMRSLTKNVGLSDQSSSAFNEQMQSLLANPESAMQAQELILRMTTNYSPS